jgi:mannose/fructose/N-acetylgalactosamine-specific phosphotransferase system component IID
VKFGDKTIGPKNLLVVFLRALLIQASWSFDRLQSLGFAYAVEPFLRRLYTDKTEYESRLRLHLEYFNTQPYLASFILGATLRLERDRVSGLTDDTDVSGLKTALMAPLGALGDSFFWGALKPFAAVMSIAFLMTGVWWAPVLFLVFYNIWHIGLRIAFVFWGYASRGDAVELMKQCRFTKLAKLFKIVSLTVLGGMLGLLPAWQPEFKPELNIFGAFMALEGLAITLILLIALRKGSSPVKLMLGLAVVCVALAYAGVI